VLEGWAQRWGSDQTMGAALLNRSGLLKEVEESLVPLQEVLLHLWHLDQAAKRAQRHGLPGPCPAIVVDLCCGKGYTPLLLSYLLAEPQGPYCHLSPWLRQCVLVDKNKAINFQHLEHGLEQDLQMGCAAVPLQVWCGVNLFDESLGLRLACPARGGEPVV
ncbi:unnamed protein product, partial [Polarella glacialis]